MWESIVTHLATLFVGDFNSQILELAGTLVRSATEHDDALVLLIQERLSGLHTEIRIHGDCISLALRKREFDVTKVRVADVHVLGVENDRCPRHKLVNELDDLDERFETFRANRKKERKVRLVRGGRTPRRADDFLAKLDKRTLLARMLRTNTFRNLRVDGVEADTYEPSSSPARLQHLHKVLCHLVFLSLNCL